MMKTEEIKDQFKQFESIVCDYHGVKCWSARELYSLLGYTQCRNFETIINKAKAACTNGEMKWFEYWKKVRLAWHEALGMGWFVDFRQLQNIFRGRQFYIFYHRSLYRFLFMVFYISFYST